MEAAAPRIRLFVMDVDGTLTDGTITYAADGTELRSFHARDGAGIKLLPKVGITPAFVSGRAGQAARRRAAELGVQEVHLGIDDKAACVAGMRERLDLPPEAVAVMGDDLSDIPAMRRAGFSAAPADAAPEVRALADFVATRPGGHGAVREAIEGLLRQEDLWDAVLEQHDAAPTQEARS